MLSIKRLYLFLAFFPACLIFSFLNIFIAVLLGICCFQWYKTTIVKFFQKTFLFVHIWLFIQMGQWMRKSMSYIVTIEAPDLCACPHRATQDYPHRATHWSSREYFVLDKRSIQTDIFLIFRWKHVVNTHWNCFAEMIPMSTHNKCFNLYYCLD